MTASVRAPMVRAAAVVAGVATGLLGGAVAGGPWWAAAGVVVVAAVGSVRDRMLGHAHAVGTLALAAGVVAAGGAWVAPLLIGGFVAALELHAAADRVTVVRPDPELAAVVPTLFGVVVLSAVLVGVGVATDGVPAAGAVLAAGAAVVALRVVAR